MPLKDRVLQSPLYWKLVDQKLQKWAYPLVTRRLGADDVFLNFGYEEDPPMSLQLVVSDEPNRGSIQLYHRTATQADIRGKRVLEVGCGHGGGASYLMRTLHPASYTGMDLNSTGVAFCQKRHRLPGLDFVRGDAQNLPFPDQSFDAVVNIESSTYYPSLPRFLAEVARVLRPGGHFLYADVQPHNGVAAWEAMLADAPMRMVSHRDISAEVRRGLEKNSQQWMGMIDRYLPALLQRFARDLVPRWVSVARRDLESGILSYRMYCFVKE
ncbi:phthiotriol/phenolphthiotriol dimycocerosates methyltransferase [Mycobacterium haemophilum]|uniref:SAM-dependent methyltransferase n=1 Tax=Mycobacterium haemophilum TaxID=29311 RepID=A0A0I9URK3_9MYCO|nr:class I SAM-dependent methyltransferase [Mycobacterium haemophilum]AKN18172.1 SAM-dependent methyltransferase [Mycobacterium haemophilum DSM 44634]KLO32998.1 SAM-dependent methyltransferase [Mycobacterium haemophilum]KLO37953.1 SAM-dependent methyltransferase [Mycobacterium haemophilum]KLO44275.1 SAM-dependent methyltransferase [Mycobacterium haemophilum]KLO55180.1 SAM-dependent methyltransferase [Mycobacterium haemophilum]